MFASGYKAIVCLFFWWLAGEDGLKKRTEGALRASGGQSDALRVTDPRSGCAGRRLGAVRGGARFFRICYFFVALGH